jgi:simple sugar transport system ATP-binding protein
VQKRIDEYHFNLDPDDYVSDISIAARQKVEILKLLYRNVSILILDEPTSVLTPQEIPKLFDELRRLRQNGHTILFISHHLDEVLELSDRTTVLKRGRNVGTVATDQTSKKELARMMVGREVVFKTRREDHEVGEKVFELEELSYTDPEGRLRLKDIDIQVHAGEIVGIAGVEGNGQFELVNMIMGLIPQREGSLIVDGEDLRQASILNRRKKISFVSQDRGNMGATLSASIKENVIMTHHRLDGRFTSLAGYVMDYQEASAFTEQVREQFSIVMDDDEDPFRSLSGGNQQKVILGRELLLDTPFILLDQPTRGLDVGSIEYVHRQILDMRREGRALLLLSADLDELFRMSDRLLVLNRGEIVADLETDETTIEEVGYLMLKGLRDETETD